MIGEIFGTKIASSQRFTREGKRLPATLIKAGPCVVVSKKTFPKDGYWALQLGFGKRKKVGKPLKGHFQKANLKTAPYFLAEVRGKKEDEKLKLGDEICLTEVLKPGDLVMVSGTSKGKGFAGVVKKWGFAGGPRTHGQSDRERAPGSIGAGTTPGRVLKGKKMAGRLGGQKVTIKGLTVMEAKGDLLTVSGLVPGTKGSFLLIKKIGEAKNFVSLFKSEERKKEEGKKKQGKEKEKEKVQATKVRIKRRKGK